MGIYLNPGNENFSAILTREIYIDKTMMLSVLNNFMATDNKYICVSRPRRFGKTFANNMIAAYYSKDCDSRELFSKLKFYNEKSFEKNLNKFNVIKWDINSEYRNTSDKDYLITDITEIVRSEFIQQFPDITFSERDSIARCITKVYAARGEKFVILLDEYDVLIRENVTDSLFTQYLDLLNGLFKSDTVSPAIALAYLTGILPIVRDKIQSKLNNFEEYTILSASDLTELVGFTELRAISIDDEYTVVREMTTGKGFADVVYIPYKDDVPALIIELKRNGSTESALNQIKEKKYFDSLSHYCGNLLFVGINYDEKAKTHECKNKKLEKSNI